MRTSNEMCQACDCFDPGIEGFSNRRSHNCTHWLANTGDCPNQCEQCGYVGELTHCTRSNSEGVSDIGELCEMCMSKLNLC